MPERLNQEKAFDVLGDILETLRFRGSVFFQSDLAAPWGMSLSEIGSPRFHIVLSGECFVGSDGHEAVQVCDEWSPHLILMDMVMPGMDGFEATRRIRATERGRDLPIIAVTASVLEEDRQLVMEAGASDFIRKPFRESELFEKIGHHLGIEYLYADEDVPDDAKDALRLTPEALQVVPAEIRRALREAVDSLDINVVRACIADIESHDSAVAAALQVVTDDYDFELLAELLGGEG